MTKANPSTVRIGLLNGPNLGRLGVREPDIYGTVTLKQVEESFRAEAAALGAEVEAFQSNHEGDLIDRIEQWSSAGLTGIVINPAALTHTSVALRDALAGSGLRAVEVHISNIYRREDFRHQSLTAPACEAVISGLGIKGYIVALRHLLEN